MAAKKRARRKRANKKKTAYQGNGVIPTAAQKKSLKQSLGIIKKDAKDIELRVGQVLDTLESVDFTDG